MAAGSAWQGADLEPPSSVPWLYQALQRTCSRVTGALLGLLLMVPSTPLPKGWSQRLGKAHAAAEKGSFAEDTDPRSLYRTGFQTCSPRQRRGGSSTDRHQKSVPKPPETHRAPKPAVAVSDSNLGLRHLVCGSAGEGGEAARRRSRG